MRFNKGGNMNKIFKLVKSKNMFIVLAIFILVPSFYFNITAYTTKLGIKEIDSFSEGIMITDMMYNNHFKSNNPFLKSIMGTIFADGSTGSRDEIYSKYINNETYEEKAYTSYQSNITAHRLIYNFIDSLFPNNKSYVVNIIKFLNALFLVVILIIILLWIRKSLSWQVPYILTFILAFCCSNFVAFGTNLYWITGSMFLPMAVSIIVVNSKKIILSKRFYMITFISAFFTCLLKQLFYVEFVTAVMISMMIPYFFYVFENKCKFKECVKLFVFPFLGAIMSFLVTCIIKVIMLCKIYEYKVAMDYFLSPIIYRILGESDSINQEISAATNYPLNLLFNDMFSAEAISVKGIISITEGRLIIISLILIMISYCTYHNRTEYRQSKEFPFIISTLISFLAPMSWFILAKPHTVVHESLCVILWYLPLNILLIALDIFIIIRLCNKYIVEIYKNLKKIMWRLCFLLLNILLCFFIIYITQDVTNYKLLNMHIVNNEGQELYNNNGIEITYYNGSLYYIAHKKMPNEFYLHITPADLSNLDEDSQNYGYVNYDFAFNELKIREPFKINGNEIVKIELPEYAIDDIVTGQYRLDNEERLNLWEQKIDLSKQTSMPSGYTFSPYDLTDNNWVRGISNDGTIILLQGDDTRLIGLKGKNIFASNGVTVKVIDVQYKSEMWTHLILDKPITQPNINELLSFTVD